MRKFERGPLSQVRNKDKLQEFLSQAIQVQSKKQLLSKKLARIESAHFDLDDSVPAVYPVFDDGMMLFDSLTATNDRTMETLFSQHLAIGQHCVELLRA